MSVAIYIASETELDGEDTSVSGKALGHVEPDILDGIEKQLGCTPLYDMVSGDPGDLADFVDEADLPPENWFPADEGLRTVRALRKHLQDNPSAVADAAEVIEDLDECERVLALLESRGIRFHFAIDF